MAFGVYQAGSTLYGIDQRGSAPVSLTLPTGVTLDSLVTPRFAVYKDFAIMVNSPSRPLTIDANLNVRVLTPDPPNQKPTLAGSSASGSLTGKYKCRQTFVVHDAFGRLIGESDFGPESAAVTVTAKKLTTTTLALSPDRVSASRLYRTTNGQSVYFQWMDLNGNTQTAAIEDDQADADLNVFAAPSLGTPPDMYLIAEFRSRVFGVSKADKENVRYSEIGAMWAWPGANQQPIPRVGSDNRGVTGFARKRDALGIGRANGFYQFTGTTDANFKIVNVSENCGIEAPDSVAIFRDVAFFLWKDGVYRWDANGITSVSDEKVRRWFIDNSTFNLSRLQYAFAQINPVTRTYRLFLASAGSTIENCWIEYDFINNKWWGPHSSHAFNPSCAFLFSTDSGLMVPMIGGRDGYVRRSRLRRTDDTNTGIDFDVVTARQDMGTPNDEKYFGEVTVHQEPQATGTLIVQSVAGEADELRTVNDNEFADEVDLTESRGECERVGIGTAMRLRFRNSEPGVDVALRGYEVNPVYPIGQR